ncbi:MAG: peptide-methionine (S)-S-oxide reductase MsrA [Clostridia bacterium]|nr:peptide-methionine (S)-S-oxide reductase MsrA [Clostridia bacterium]
MKTIYLAGGCFWGLQRFLDSAEGVLETEVGYANGKKDNPTYEQVKYEHTGHAETVKVVYDESILPLKYIIHRFLQVIDPYSVNKQGEDVGEQYRTGIYFENNEDMLIAKQEIGKLEKASNKHSAIEVLPLVNFWKAEEYHQKYLEKNPTGYCHIFQKF